MVEEQGPALRTATFRYRDIRRSEATGGARGGESNHWYKMILQKQKDQH
jgi:hypothetical protein